MSVDTAFQRLRDANPVTDPAALRKERVDPDVFVASTRQRSIDMQGTETERVEQATVRRRRVATVLAAAFLVSIVGIGVVLVASMRNSDEVVSLESRVTIIAAQAGAYSDGELDAWLAYYTPDAELWNGWFSLAQPDLRLHRAPYWFALGDQWVITGVCTDVSAGEVACPMQQRDDYHGRAGIAVEAVYTFTFNENDKITAFRLDGYATALAPYEAFDMRFLRWLDETHPGAEVADGATAMLYVDEFIAQSDHYPIQQDTP